MIVRWGLGELGPLLDELGLEQPLLVTSARLRRPRASRAAALRRGSAARAARRRRGRDRRRRAARTGSSAVGGGSAIDTAKAVSAATGLPLVAVPDDVLRLRVDAVLRDARRGAPRERPAVGGAHTVAIVYEPALTLDLPRGETVGTALNALAHCAEALYAGPCDDATTGAELHRALAPRRGRRRPSDLGPRTRAARGCDARGHGARRARALPRARAWRRRSEDGTARRTARSTRSASLPRSASTRRSCRTRVGELARAMRRRRCSERASRSLPGSADSSGCAISASPTTSFTDVAAQVVERPGARANPRPVTVGDDRGAPALDLVIR